MNHDNSKANILLVDDELEILASLRGLLRREFNLFTAQSGKEALEILRHECIHVIMTDQRMPEMTGAELLSEARICSANSIRMIFTGYADIRAVIDAVNSGKLFRYITKPWDPDELVALLQEAAGEYAKQQRQIQLYADLQHSLDNWVQQAEQSTSDSIVFDLPRGKDLQTRVHREIQDNIHSNQAPA